MGRRPAEDDAEGAAPEPDANALEQTYARHISALVEEGREDLIPAIERDFEADEAGRPEG